MIKRSLDVSKVDLVNLETAIANYQSNHDGNYPPRFETLLEEGSLGELPFSPWTHERARIVAAGDKECLGGVSYLAARDIESGGIVGYALVMYIPLLKHKEPWLEIYGRNDNWQGPTLCLAHSMLPPIARYELNQQCNSNIEFVEPSVSDENE